jgi:hypothetical protein
VLNTKLQKKGEKTSRRVNKQSRNSENKEKSSVLVTRIVILSPPKKGVGSAEATYAQSSLGLCHSGILSSISPFHQGSSSTHSSASSFQVQVASGSAFWTSKTSGNNASNHPSSYLGASSWSHTASSSLGAHYCRLGLGNLCHSPCDKDTTFFLVF